MSHNLYPLTKLHVMQSDLRHWQDIENMSSFVSFGGIWDKKFIEHYNSTKETNNSSLIVISVFEDGSQYIHDGLHRCVSTYLGGRNFLYPEEYLIKKWKYEDYIEFAPQNQWYTPFDPRTHIRIANLSEFKEKVKNLCDKSYDEAFSWVTLNSHAYKSLRQFSTLEEFIFHFKEKLNKKL